MKKILVADSLSPEVTQKTGMDEEELIKTIPDFHATVVRGATKVTKNAIEAASNMELIVRAGIGLDNIDLAAAKEKGIHLFQLQNMPSD
jgi:D-3-phosphoglycerate dehydrogenase